MTEENKAIVEKIETPTDTPAEEWSITFDTPTKRATVSINRDQLPEVAKLLGAALNAAGIEAQYTEEDIVVTEQPQ